MTKEKFLRECETYLGEQLPGETIGRRRWRRGAGRGRFEGRGIIRWYSETCIQFALTSPAYVGIFTSPVEALIWLREKCLDQTGTPVREAQ